MILTDERKKVDDKLKQIKKNKKWRINSRHREILNEHLCKNFL